jgi:hypothetical protein
MRSEEKVGESKEQTGKNVVGKKKDGKREMRTIGNGRESKGCRLKERVLDRNQGFGMVWGGKCAGKDGWGMVELM